MWKRSMRNLMLLLVSSNSILFQHLFSLILVETIGCPIKVRSPGEEMIVNSGCHDLVIEFGKYKFPVNLIILNSQGLDVILGMDWMTKHKGVIDCANHTVSLTTPENKRIRFKTNFESKGVC